MKFLQRGLPFPISVLLALGRFTGRGAKVELLIGSLDLDNHRDDHSARVAAARVSAEEGLVEIARAWKVRAMILPIVATALFTVLGVEEGLARVVVG